MAHRAIIWGNMYPFKKILILTATILFAEMASAVDCGQLRKEATNTSQWWEYEEGRVLKQLREAAFNTPEWRKYEGEELDQLREAAFATPEYRAWKFSKDVVSRGQLFKVVENTPEFQAYWKLREGLLEVAMDTEEFQEYWYLRNRLLKAAINTQKYQLYRAVCFSNK